ncbi:MAG: copper resistance protein [Rhodospirillaceae bacterium]|jgi:methionine-rich copper-binding protein CopC|nr:copper resistance protein [Rhodospirillaceae bacterium]
MLALLLLPTAGAEAHAIIMTSKPAVNSKVAEGPFEIFLQYNSRIDMARSRVIVVAPDGHTIRVAITPGNSPGSMTGHVTADMPGRWTLRWQVLSADGHITRGEIPFVVTGKTAP